MGSTRRHVKDYFEPLLVFASMTFFADMAMTDCSRAKERYFPAKAEREFPLTHTPIFLLAELIGALPILAFYLTYTFAYMRPVRRCIWAAGGAIAGLTISLLVHRPTIPIDKHADMNTRVILLILVKACTPKTALSWSNWLTHAGLVSSVLVSRTAFGKRLDPSLPQTDDDPSLFLPAKKGTENESGLPNSRNPVYVLLASFGMLWVASIELTRVGEDYIFYFSKTSEETERLDTWMFAIPRVFCILLYAYALYNYIVSTRTLPWNMLCAALAGIAAGISLMLSDGNTTWQIQAQDLAIVIFVMHLGNMVGFFSRHTAMAHRDYRMIGLQHPGNGLEKSASSLKPDEKVTGEDSAPIDEEKAGEAV